MESFRTKHVKSDRHAQDQARKAEEAEQSHKMAEKAVKDAHRNLNQ